MKRIAKPVRCAIYTRVSTDQGLEQDFNSLDAQHDASQASTIRQRPGNAGGGHSRSRTRLSIQPYSRGLAGRFASKFPGGKITENFEKNAPPGDFHFEINKRFQLFAAKIPYATEQGIFRVHPIHIPVYIQSTFPSIKVKARICWKLAAEMTCLIGRSRSRSRRPVLFSRRVELTQFEFGEA